MVGTFVSDFLEEEFHTDFGWLVEHGSTWRAIFPRKARHRLLSGPAVVCNGYRLKGSYTVATKKWLERRRSR